MKTPFSYSDPEMTWVYSSTLYFKASSYASSREENDKNRSRAPSKMAKTYHVQNTLGLKQESLRPNSYRRGSLNSYFLEYCQSYVQNQQIGIPVKKML